MLATIKRLLQGSSGQDLYTKSSIRRKQVAKRHNKQGFKNQGQITPKYRSQGTVMALVNMVYEFLL